MKKYFISLTITIYYSFLSAQPVIQFNGYDFTVGSVPVSVMLADLDGDGDLDLLASNQNSNTVSIRFNNGLGNFTVGADVDVGSFPYSVKAADFDGDGDNDFVVANSGNNNLGIKFNNGSGNFSGSYTIAVGTSPFSVEAADIDNDGDVDLLASNYGSNTVSVLFNNGSGSFSGGTSIDVGTNPISIVAADVDNDGDRDFLVNNGNGNAVSVRNNNGSGSFSGGSEVPVGTRPHGIFTSDLDADGDLDFLTGNFYGNSSSLRFNNGSGGFGGGTDISLGTVGEAVAAADVDRDGDMDILVSAYNTIRIYFNSVSGNFGPTYLNVSVGDRANMIALGDLDRDGDLDFVTSNAGASSISVRFQCSGSIYYRDVDGDGYGTAGTSTTTCSSVPPAGYVTTNTDCNDNDNTIYPQAPELCDTKDNDCDGQVDEGVQITFYRDADGDTHGDAGNSTQACSAPTGYVASSDDCNDADASIYTGATELCDGKDNDCDGQTDEGVTSTFYRDADSDGRGDANNSTQACSAPSGYVTSSDDCNDADASIHPGASEICDGKDNDCDGQIDEGVQITFYRDADGDTHGDAGNSTQACTAPTGYVASSDDCNDADASVHPGAPEVCDGKDNDCNGQVDEGCPPPSSLPAISINDVVVYESDGQATLTVTLSSPASTSITINYATSDGTAIGTAPKGKKGTTIALDYTANSGTITIPAGSLSATINITVINDNLNEGDENFNVILSLNKPNAKKATIADGNGLVTIINGTRTVTTAAKTGKQINAELEKKPLTKLGVTVYPNPASYSFIVNTSSKNQQPLTVTITDMMGRVIETKRGIAANGRFSLGSAYRPGTYFAQVRQGNEKVVLKLVKAPQ